MGGGFTRDNSLRYTLMVCTFFCVLYFSKKFKIKPTTLRYHFSPPLSAKITTFVGKGAPGHWELCLEGPSARLSFAWQSHFQGFILQIFLPICRIINYNIAISRDWKQPNSHQLLRNCCNVAIKWSAKQL